MISKLLSFMFPPQLPGRVQNWECRTIENFDEGWAGNVRPKEYRDGIDRHFQQESANQIVNTMHDYFAYQIK